MTDNNTLIPKYWIGKDKKKISCKEKIKVMYDNLDEFQEMLTDIYDEAILLGVDESQFKKVLLNIIKNMKNNLKDV